MRLALAMALATAIRQTMRQDSLNSVIVQVTVGG
jgi:hypothetical protein